MSFNRLMVLKRLIEFVLALIVLLPVFCVCLLLMVWIRFETPGFPLVLQKRVGRNGCVFTCLKLRTFALGSDVVATHEAFPHQITGAGRVIRPLHLDELPQIWNVLTGDMSFVGPRPCLPSMTEVIEARRAHHVLAQRPGITGLAQIEGADMREPDHLAQLDALYIQKWSFVLDLKICLATLVPALWPRWRARYVTL
jgi:O-antigen biosynthesis protein WbqP